MTLGSLPFVWDFVRAGGDVGLMNRRRQGEKGVDGGSGTGGRKRELLGQVVCTVFMAFLISDMGVGLKYYRQVSFDGFFSAEVVEERYEGRG